MNASYTVVFDRIGRNHGVKPMTINDVEDPDELAALIFKYGRRYLASRDVQVVVDMEKMTGRFYAGVRNGGDFTIMRST